MDIGKKIKMLRNKNNLTLNELASRLELSKGFLSQLENNLTSPSIKTLENIIEVLGSNFEEFFKDDKELQLHFKKDDFYIDNKDESSIITWVVPNAQKNEMEPILLDLKHLGESKEVYEHEGEEFIYILQGKIDLIDLSNDKTYTLSKGETFYAKGDFRHKLINRYIHNAKVLWICTPPIF